MIQERYGVRAIRPHSRVSIEDIAAKTRKHFVGDAPLYRIDPLELFYSCERIPFADHLVRYGVCEMPLGVEARTSFFNGAYSLDLSSATYEGLEAGAGRAAWTVCHEIGHIVLHREELKLLEGVHQRMLNRGKHKVYEDTEYQANVFAAEFLMPREGLSLLDFDGQLTARIVANQYGASLEASEYRIRNYLKGKKK